MTFKVFGYGSLVNRGTLPPYVHAERRTVKGWRRAWRKRSPGLGVVGACSLSVVEAPDEEIDGLVVTFEDGMLETITAREHNYDPLRLADDPDVIIFRAKAEVDDYGDHEHPILLSYLDATAQGFLREFGEEGLDRFIATTDGWHVPIVDDRAQPRYARAQQLSSAEEKRINQLLRSVDATPVRAQEKRSA